jgi:predicted ATPase with chaperone activity
VNVHTYQLRNLAPADLKSDASGFDLPIALGLLIGSAQVSFVRPGNFAIHGEQAPTGETRSIKGILAFGPTSRGRGPGRLARDYRQCLRGRPLSIGSGGTS